MKNKLTPGQILDDHMDVIFFEQQHCSCEQYGDCPNCISRTAIRRSFKVFDDMYEALVELSKAYRDLKVGSGGFFDDSYREAQNAIRKARGES